MVAFCIQHDFTLRMIETMPMGGNRQERTIPDLQPVKARLQQRFGLIDGVMPEAAGALLNPDGAFPVASSPQFANSATTCNVSDIGRWHPDMCWQAESLELRPLLRPALRTTTGWQSRCPLNSSPSATEFRENHPGGALHAADWR